MDVVLHYSIVLEPSFVGQSLGTRLSAQNLGVQLIP